MHLRVEATRTRWIVQPLACGAVAAAMTGALFRSQGKMFWNHPFWMGGATFSGWFAGAAQLPTGPFMRVPHIDFFSPVPDAAEARRRRLVAGEEEIDHPIMEGLLSVWGAVLNQGEVSIQQAPILRWHEQISALDEGVDKTFLREEVSRLGRATAAAGNYRISLIRSSDGAMFHLDDLNGEMSLRELLQRVSEPREQADLPEELKSIAQSVFAAIPEEGDGPRLIYGRVNLLGEGIPPTLTLAELGIGEGTAVLYN